MILHYKTRISVRFWEKTATFWEVLIFKQLRISVRLWETSTTLCERKKIASHLMKSGHYIDTKLGV